MTDQGCYDHYVPASISQSHSIPTQPCNYFMDPATTSNNIPSDYSSSSTLGKPSTSTTLSGTTVPGSNPALSEDNKLVYHSMTCPQLMSWSVGHHPIMDAATARRLMTPLHVVTSMGNEHVPVYPPGSFAASGGGLLKIATDVQPAAGATNPAAKKPSTSAEFQRVQHASLQQHQTNYLPYGMVQKPSFCPTLAVAPITSGDLGVSGLKRPAPDEPAPNVKWPHMKKRKLRTTFTKEQTNTMESWFQQSMYLAVTTRKQLAQQLGLEDAQVKTWFQNRRMRYKRQHPNEHIAPTRNAPPSCRSSAQVASKPLHCPPAPVQNQFVVPTPPPSVNTPPVAPPRNSSACGEPFPGIPPSPVYNFGMAPSVGSPDNCCPGFGAPVFPSLPHHPYPSAGFGVHQWISANLFGPQGGAQFPPRHI